MAYLDNLRVAFRTLPSDLRYWMSKAFESGEYSIRSHVYDGGPGGGVCPVTAAAKCAGAWKDGGIAPSHRHWGSPTEPSDLVEDFAAYFDLVSETAGLRTAIGVLESEIELIHLPDRATAYSPGLSNKRVQLWITNNFKAL